MTSRMRLGALVAALALVGACSGGGDDADRVATADDTTTTSSQAAEAPTTSLAEGAGAASGSGTATTRAGRETATTKAPAGAATATRDPNAVPQPAKTGTYTYAQSGTMPDGNPAPASGTLTVSGGATQSFDRVFSPNHAVTITYQFRGDGPYLTGATVRTNGITISCPFAGVPLPPWPPTPGRTFGGTTTCSNGLTATLSGTVGARSTKAGHDVVRIDSTLKITGSGVNVDVVDVEDWAVDLRVPTYSQQTWSGSSPFGPVSGQVTSTLTATP